MQDAKVVRKPGDAKFEAVHESERDWENLRFDKFHSKMLFHPRPERPTEPKLGHDSSTNTLIQRYRRLKSQ